MPHVAFSPEQFELVADATKRLPDPNAVATPTLLLDQDVASALANAVYDRNNPRRASRNNYGNTPDTRFVIDVSELSAGYSRTPFLVSKLPEDAGSGYRIHLPNAESDRDTWVVNETFAYAFQRILDREEYSERVHGGLMLALGGYMTAGVGGTGLAASVPAIEYLGASPAIIPVLGIGGAVLGATCATGFVGRDVYRRWVSNGNSQRILNRRHMRATLRHIAKLVVDPVIYTDQKAAVMDYTPPRPDID